MEPVDKDSKKVIINNQEFQMDISELNMKGKWLHHWLFESAFKNIIDPEVIQFIAHMRFHGGDNKYSEQAIYNLFSAGYCYHFAIILKTVFNRGKICLYKDYRHILWVDDKNNMDIPYDIGGMYYDYDPKELIPIDNLSEEELEPYIHCSGKYSLDHNI